MSSLSQIGLMTDLGLLLLLSGKMVVAHAILFFVENYIMLLLTYRAKNNGNLYPPL